MRASRRVAPGRSEVVETDVPRPGPGEVLVRVTACGVCASELHPWADAPAGEPLRFGHEPVGVVQETGAGVTGFAPGDRVTGLFWPSFAELAVAREDRLLHVPPGLPDHAALGEPLACLVNAARRTPVAPGDTVVLIGLGYMGLGMLQLLRLSGAATILAVDPRAEARRHALDLGADRAVAPDEVPEDLELTEFRDWESGRGAAVVVEASGTQAGLSLAGRLVRPHGLLSILGFHQGGERAVDVAMWNWKAIDVVNAHVRRYADLMDAMRRGLALQAAGKVDLGRLVTHEYALDEVDRAFGDLRGKPAGFVKGVVRP